jgi:hypothetical protein
MTITGARDKRQLSEQGVEYAVHTWSTKRNPALASERYFQSFTASIIDDQCTLVRPYTPESVLIPSSGIRPQNLQLLAVLNEWYNSPDELGDAWWDEFERDVRNNRLEI